MDIYFFYNWFSYIYITGSTDNGKMIEKENIRKREKEKTRNPYAASAS